jgi:hypothetical protein
MAPKNSKSNAQKPPGRKIKILQVKKTEQQSLLSEYFYRLLGILFVVLAFVMMGFGMRWDEAGVIALWIVGMIFVGRQVRRSVRGERTVQKEKRKPAVLAEPVKDYKAPDLPRVSKDFSPLPPAGDKRYPPPSPFIKPPK